MLPQQTKFPSQGSLIIQFLVVIGIIVTLLIISSPFLRQYQPNFKLRAEAKQLISDLRYTQQLTISEQKVHYLEMDMINNSYQILREEEIPNPPILIKSVNLDKNISFHQINLTNNKVIFNPYGGVSESGSIILINSVNTTTTVAVKPSGYVHWSN